MTMQHEPPLSLHCFCGVVCENCPGAHAQQTHNAAQDRCIDVLRMRLIKWSNQTMKLILSSLATISVVMTLLVNAALAVDPAAVAAETLTNAICPINGTVVDPAITTEYEGRKWSFAKEECKTKWLQAREDSLYQKLGGKAALEAVVDAFYVKVLADERVKHFFEDVSMDKQRRKQKEFLSTAFGGPLPWTGKDMRKAHAGMGLTEVEFNAIAENLVNTLKELKISQELIDQVVAVALSVKDDVLGRPKL
jgi:hemoglobin